MLSAKCQFCALNTFEKTCGQTDKQTNKQTNKLDIAIDIVPTSLRIKSCDHQGHGYIGTFLSKELSHFYISKSFYVYLALF